MHCYSEANLDMFGTFGRTRATTKGVPQARECRTTARHFLACGGTSNGGIVYLRLIIGILSLRTFAHLTLLSLSNPALNLTFSLLPITSSHPHASASDSTFDYWRYINI